jgi:hypothetical protein
MCPWYKKPGLDLMRILERDACLSEGTVNDA